MGSAMNGRRWLRALVVWLVIMGAESIHGAVRTLVIAPLIGDSRARHVAVLTGSLLIVVIAASLIRWLHLETVRSRPAVGLVWVVLTVGFELLLGRGVFDHSWERILSDYELRRGGILPVGLAVLVLSPFIAVWLRPVPSRQRPRAVDAGGNGVTSRRDPRRRSSRCPVVVQSGPIQIAREADDA